MAASPRQALLQAIKIDSKVWKILQQKVKKL